MKVVGVNEQGLRVGQDHQRAKLMDADIEAMLFLRGQGVQYKRLAEIFECSKAQAWKICNMHQRSQRASFWRTLDEVSMPRGAPALIT